MYLEFTEYKTGHLMSVLKSNILQVDKDDDGLAVICYREPIHFRSNKNKKFYGFYGFYAKETYEEIMSKLNK